MSTVIVSGTEADLEQDGFARQTEEVTYVL